MCNKTGIIVGWSILSLVGIALVVLAAISGPVINSVIENGVKKVLVIKPDFGDWKSDTIQDFLVSDVTYSYYAFNLTNFGAVTQTGAVPTLEEVGPYVVTETTYIYNYSWPGDNTFRYMSWWRKTWKTTEDYERASNTKITSLNPAYILAVATFNGQQPCNPASQETTLAFSLAASGLNGVRNAVLESSSLRVGVRMAALSNVWVRCAASQTADVCRDFWNNENDASSSNFASFGGRGFRLGVVGTVGPAVAAAIWNSSSPYSLLSPFGQVFWSKMYGALLDAAGNKSDPLLVSNKTFVASLNLAANHDGFWAICGLGDKCTDVYKIVQHFSFRISRGISSSLTESTLQMLAVHAMAFWAGNIGQLLQLGAISAQDLVPAWFFLAPVTETPVTKMIAMNNWTSPDNFLIAGLNMTSVNASLLLDSLLSPASPYAFTSPNGAGFWLTVNTSGASAGVQTLAANWPYEAHNLFQIRTYYLTRLQQILAPLNFETEANSLTTSSIASCPGDTTTSKLLYCQMATSWYSKQFGNNTIMALDPAQNAGCIGLKGLATAANKPEMGCVGGEINAFITNYFTVKSLNPTEYTSSLLTTDQVTAIMSANSTEVSNVGNLGLALAYWGGVAALTGNTTNLFTVVGNVAASDLPKFGFNPATFASRQNVWTAIIQFMTQYVPLNFVIPKLGEKNTGLFVVRSPSDIMLGYTPGWKYSGNPTCTGGLNDDQPAYYQYLAVCRVLAENNDFLLQNNRAFYPGILSNWSSQNDHFLNSKHGYYEINTGEADYNEARSLKMFRNATQFWYLGDIVSLLDPYGCDCVYNDSMKVPSTASPFQRACADDKTQSLCDKTCKKAWDEPEIINGASEGRASKPFLYRDSQRLESIKIWSYTTSGMRLLSLAYVGDSEVKGIKTRRYKIDPKGLYTANAAAEPDTHNLDNVKYKMNHTPSGVVDLSQFFFSAPIYLAQPFFFKSPVAALNLLTANFSNSQYHVTPLYSGEPDELYDTWLDVEPLTGLTVQGHKRLQYTLVLNKNMFNSFFWTLVFLPTKTFTNYDSERVIYWPAFWADEFGIIDDDDAKDFRTSIYGGRVLQERLEIGGYAFGGFFLLIGFLGITKQTAGFSGGAGLQTLPSRSNI